MSTVSAEAVQTTSSSSDSLAAASTQPHRDGDRDRANKGKRRWLAPEVIQTSAMDCGPASLKILLEGFGIKVSYGRLREACQTDVDGSSIDTLEEVANQLGLEAEQILIPYDHLLLPQARALPALVVVTLPDGMTHFKVVWRRLRKGPGLGDYVQVIDPASGRRWVKATELQKELYLHRMTVPAAAWREWAASTSTEGAGGDGGSGSGSGDFLKGLDARLAALGVSKAKRSSLVEAALADQSWRGLASLDAATRLATSLVKAGGIGRGPKVELLITTLTAEATQELVSGAGGVAIPRAYWSAFLMAPASAPAQEAADGAGAEDNEEPELMVQGALLVRVLGKRIAPVTPHPAVVLSNQPPDPPQAKDQDQNQDPAYSHSPEEAAAQTPAPAAPGRAETFSDSVPTPLLSPELVAALEEKPARPLREYFKTLRQDGLFDPLMVGIALLVAAGGVTFEALLFRTLLNLPSLFTTRAEQLAGTVALCIFGASLVLLELFIAQGVRRLGRKVETRLRIAFLTKVPRLGDHYFRSRLNSDMAERSHNLHLVRDLPELVRLLMAQIAQVVLNVVAIILLFPQGAGLSVLFVVTAVGLPFLLQPLSVERNLTQRTHQAALARFYLDSLLGLIPLRAHHAETIMRREHESRLVEWARSSLGLIRIQIPAVAVQVFFTLVIHLLLMVAYIRSQLVSFVATTTSIGSVGPSSGGAGSSSGGGGSQLLILNGPAVTNILLMVYWTAAIYPLGRAIADNLQKYPTQRNVLLRLLEPLGAGVAPASAGTGEAGVAHFRSSPPTQTEESESPAVMGGAGYTEESAASPEHEHGRKREGARARERVQRCGPGGGGVAISIKDGGVRAAGHTLLEGIDLEIAPGEHVAIVGPSGAGKSSLVGLLLGWQRVATGQLLVDGQALTGAGSEADEAAALATLRQETAWVDPAIQLFNRSLLANLHYGSPPGGHGQYGEVGHILHEAELIQVVQNLPNGLQTPLGENGAMVSGGEGQRVRLGRAMARQKARLVILDEPFRGLGRDQRHHLLQLSRQLWQRATLLCITHDLSEAARFDRVIVMEHGTIVEDNHPTTLLQNPTSRFWEMLMAEASAGKDIWNGSGWRKFELSGGRLSERTGTGIEPGTGMPNLYIRSGI